MKASLPIAFGTEHEYVIHLSDLDSRERNWFCYPERDYALRLLKSFRDIFYPNLGWGADLEELVEWLSLKFYASHVSLRNNAEYEPEKKMYIAEMLDDMLGWEGYMTPLGGRFYLDHGYFEGCTPESSDPFELLACELAQDNLLAKEFNRLFADDPQKPRLYKNISDGQGHSQAAHRNFCVSSDLWYRLTSVGGRPHSWLEIDFRTFSHYTRETWLLATWHVVEQVLGGAGKYGRERPAEFNYNGALNPTNLQISGRADFIATLLGMETTSNRPLINCRPEPLADTIKYGRYHCINGDANRAEWSHLFKMGLTAIFLGMLADDACVLDYYITDPVRAVRQLSLNPELDREIEVSYFNSLRTGSLKPLQILGDILSEMGRYLSSREHPAWCARIHDKAVWAAKMLEEKPEVLETVLDWKIKQFMGRHSSNPFSAHLNYHALAGPNLLYQKWVDGEVLETVISRDDVLKYENGPAETTRAYFRGMLFRRFCRKISFKSSNWERMVFRNPSRSVILPHPDELTKDDCGDIFEKEDLQLETVIKLARSFVPKHSFIENPGRPR